MSRRSDREKMVRREAKAHGFVVERVGNEWKVTNPATNLAQSVPDRATGNGLANARSRIRQLATRTPMRAAVAADPSEQEPRAGDNWRIGDLVAAAYRSGVTFDVEHGRLRISAHMDNRSWVDVLRRREDEVMAFLVGELARQHTPDPEPALGPETPQGVDEVMPKVGDVARIEGLSRKENLAVDARALYDLLREEAAKQGDERGTNARVEGVLWTGTLTSVLRTVGADWDSVYQEEVSRYLRDTGHIRCQRRGNPSIWWIRDTWNDGNLTTTRQPTPSDVPPRTTPRSGPAAKPSPAPPPAPAPAADEYTQLMKLLETGRTAASTIDQLESEVAGLRREIEKNAMFLSARAELRADVEALQAENRRLRQELAKLEPFKQFIKAVKETDL
jgi:FtsZ-binding cell division protein ZapB